MLYSRVLRSHHQQAGTICHQKLVSRALKYRCTIQRAVMSVGWLIDDLGNRVKKIPLPIVNDDCSIGNLVHL